MLEHKSLNGSRHRTALVYSPSDVLDAEVATWKPLSMAVIITQSLQRSVSLPSPYRWEKLAGRTVSDLLELISRTR